MWRLQIILSVVSGLPGSPLWLAALYSLKFKPVNMRFVPPMWLAPGIIVMQLVTVFIPIIEGWKLARAKSDALALISAWEKHDRHVESDSSLLSRVTSNCSEQILHKPSLPSMDSSTRINTMASLKKALDVNPDPLLNFAANREFSGENILFLMQVKSWRMAYEIALGNKLGLSAQAANDLLQRASEIYTSLINEKTAEFPINIEYAIRAQLDTIFKNSKTDDEKLGTPLELTNPQVKQVATSEIWTQEKRMTTISVEALFAPHPGVRPTSEERKEVRPGLDINLFDAAEKSILYLVLTNTWQKFVREESIVVCIA